MKKRDGLVFVFMFLAIFLFTPNVSADVPAWFIESMHNDEAILAPGTTTYCDKNFTVKNMSDEVAHVQVILGNGSNYAFDMLEPGATVAYSLSGGYEKSGGWEEAKNVRIDDARIVNSAGGTGNIKVFCK